MPTTYPTRPVSAVLLTLGMLSHGLANAETVEPLPEPLTLDYALSLADRHHPDLELAEAVLQGARAEQQAAETALRPRLHLEGALKAVEPNDPAKEFDSTHNDSWVKLRLSKKLYDFGRSGSALDAAEAEIKGREWAFYDLRQQRRLDIMLAYYQVLLADLEYSRDNEAMAIAYVRMDRARNRNELGQLSDVELLRAEADYQRGRQTRAVSEANQRATRSALALALNRPGQLSASVEMPAATANRPAEGDVDYWSSVAMENNPRLRSLRSRVRAAENRVRAARAEGLPLLRGELEAAAYNRKSLTRDLFSAALILDVPLLTGGETDARVARQQARLRERRAELSGKELEIRQAVLELWLEIQQLQLRRQELEILGDSRELDLDLRRTEYELELTSDLGDSMTRISDYRLQLAENQFNLSLARARLDALAGRLLGGDRLNSPGASVGNRLNAE